MEDLIKEKLIEAGLKSVAKEEEEAREGGKEGFEICHSLYGREAFKKCLSERYRRELELFNDADLKEYWHHRWATLQIEFVYEALKFWWGGDTTHSARAGIAFGKALEALRQQTQRIRRKN